jgi:predicted XRE-type DNA-binding protein
MRYKPVPDKEIRWVESSFDDLCAFPFEPKKKGSQMTTDTQIRHVTQPDANLFAELGFSPADAVQFQAQSQQQINDSRALKAQLMGELSKWIDDNHLKQAQAAEILMVSRPRVSDVVNMKVGKFTIDTLVDMLSRIGKPVRLVVY